MDIEPAFPSRVLVAALVPASLLVPLDATAGSYQDIIDCLNGTIVCFPSGSSNVASRGSGTGATFYWTGAGGNPSARHLLFE